METIWIKRMPKGWDGMCSISILFSLNSKPLRCNRNSLSRCLCHTWYFQNCSCKCFIRFHDPIYVDMPEPKVPCGYNEVYQATDISWGRSRSYSIRLFASYLSSICNLMRKIIHRISLWKHTNIVKKCKTLILFVAIEIMAKMSK